MTLKSLALVDGVNSFTLVSGAAARPSSSGVFVGIELAKGATLPAHGLPFVPWPSCISASFLAPACLNFGSETVVKLPAVHDTRQVPAVCDVLPRGDDLRPGDLLNISGKHVVLCAGWSKPDRSWIYYDETGGVPQYWKPALKEAPPAAMLALGDMPLRYRGMAHPPVKQGGSAKEVLSRAVKATAMSVPNPTVGEP